MTLGVLWWRVGGKINPNLATFGLGWSRRQGGRVACGHGLLPPVEVVMAGLIISSDFGMVRLEARLAV